MNVLFFQVPTPEFAYGVCARVEGLELVLGHLKVLGHFGFLCLKVMFFAGAQVQCSAGHLEISIHKPSLRLRTVHQELQ